MRHLRGQTWPLEVAAGVYQLRAARASVTAVLSGREVVLVDTGGRGSLPHIEAGLGALGRSLRDIRLIVATHCHPDHVGSVAAVAGASGARLAAHGAEAGFLAGERPFPSPFRNRVLARASTRFVPRLYGGAAEVDVLLRDGDRLPVDEEIRVVHAPGHTPGSICLHLPGRGVLVVGDALQYLRGRLAPPSAMYTADMRAACASVRKLADLEFETISFSHFPPLREGAKRLLRDLADLVAP